MGESSQDNLKRLLVELKRVELKLHHQVMTLRHNNRHEAAQFRGLYISEGEIDTIISSKPFQTEEDRGGKSTLVLQAPAESKTSIAIKGRENTDSGFRLRELERLFNLSPFEVDVLLLCLLPELDLKYQRLYAYLQDDVTKKKPTVDLVLRLLCDSFTDKLAAREAFSPDAPLLKYHLLNLSDGNPLGASPLLARSLHGDERVISYLLGSDRLDSCLLPFTKLLHPKVKFSDVILPAEMKDRLIRLARQFKDEGFICYLQGAAGTGKQITAEAICSELGLPLIIVDAHRMVTADISVELAVAQIFREGLLQNTALYINNYEVLLASEESNKPGSYDVIRELEKYPRWVFLASKDRYTGEWGQKKRFICIEFPMPAYAVRRQLWERQWDGQVSLADDVDFSDLANKFRFNGGQIIAAALMAQSLALWRTPENGLVTVEDLYLACRKQSAQRLGTLAYQIQPAYCWNDIILPEDQKQQLYEICSYVKHYHTVYSDWGFGQKISRGKGLNILFAGPSGTGKTMAAEIMANELGLALYRIDLSAIVSKYIGETEKNLDRIFEEGEASNAILFFDEADALFGKRSEVRDSHDRYANIEVAYLLQKMEEYEGMVILATNLRKNMDEAFARRLHFTVEFPLPEESNRHRIWRGIFPAETPVARDVDLSFLSRQFRITGGNIKNIALNAAFLAAQDGGCITMECLIRATKREYQKMGKLCTEGDFAQYFDLVKW